MSSKPLLERNFWSVTWPIVIDISLGMGLAFTDFIFLSQISDNAAAAVGAILPILLISETLYFPLGQGCSTVIGKALGGKKYDQIGAIHGICILLAFCLGLIILSAGQLIHADVGLWFGLSGELNANASMYMQIITIGLLFLTVQKVLSAIMRSHGSTKWLMYSAIIMNVVNISLNTVFLMNLIDTGLAPIQNIAMASAIASACGMLWCLLGVLTQLSYPTIITRCKKTFKQIANDILRIATPSVFEPLNYQVSQAAIMTLIIPMGAVAIATKAYVMTCLMVVIVFELAIAIGTQIYIAHHIGAKQTEQAHQRLRKNVFQAIAISTGINILLYISASYILTVFTSDPEIIELGKMLLLVGILWEPAKTVNLVVGFSLRASGDAKFSSYIGISLWLVALPVAYFLGVYSAYGIIGIWIALTIDENIRAGLHFWRWNQRYKNMAMQ